jgi:hypothetical protein
MSVRKAFQGHRSSRTGPASARTRPPGGYRVDDAGGQALAYVYGRDVQLAHQAEGLTWDEARRIAAGIARLPELMAPIGREDK